jgi:hypothetical protein
LLTAIVDEIERSSISSTKEASSSIGWQYLKILHSYVPLTMGEGTAWNM